MMRDLDIIIKETLDYYTNFIGESRIQRIKEVILSHKWECDSGGYYNFDDKCNYSVRCTKCGICNHFTDPVTHYSPDRISRILSGFDESYTCEEYIIKGIIE